MQAQKLAWNENVFKVILKAWRMKFDTQSAFVEYCCLILMVHLTEKEATGKFDKQNLQPMTDRKDT